MHGDDHINQTGTTGRTAFLCLVVLLLFRPSAAAEPSLLLAAVGDVMPARTVTARLTQHNSIWAWEKIAPLLRQADLRFCNFECTAARGGRAIPKPYSFRVDPKLAGALLAAGGFDVASLANNHTYDYGRSALGETIAALDEAGIAAPGAGTGRTGALTPRQVTRNGLSVAFVAYTCWTPEGYLPADAAPALATLDEGTLAAELKAAKAGADLLVVSLHWGKEYARIPTTGQRRIARLAIDAGADLVLGHHPHVAQPVEIYRDRPILYSLGNCLFDRTNRFRSSGLLALIRLSRSGVAVERQIPLRIDDARPVPSPQP